MQSVDLSPPDLFLEGNDPLDEGLALEHGALAIDRQGR
jgi:hypothetical protein